MPSQRKDPNSIEQKRRQLEQQEKLLSTQMTRLSDQLRRGGDALDDDPKKPAELPVWRLEEDGRNTRPPELSPQRRRNLARQRQRDMVIFFIMMGALIVVVILVWALARSHGQPIIGG